MTAALDVNFATQVRRQEAELKTMIAAEAENIITEMQALENRLYSLGAACQRNLGVQQIANESAIRIRDQRLSLNRIVVING